MCRLVNAIRREESTGNPLKVMLKAIDIPPHQMNESSIDAPIVPNRVLQHASKFHTSTDQEVTPPFQDPKQEPVLNLGPRSLLLEASRGDTHVEWGSISMVLSGHLQIHRMPLQCLPGAGLRSSWTVL